MIDPHTAVALAGSRCDNQNENVPTIILSTAHPAKFSDAVEKATGHKPHMPSKLSALFDLDERFRLPCKIVFLQGRLRTILLFLHGALTESSTLSTPSQPYLFSSSATLN